MLAHHNTTSIPGGQSASAPASPVHAAQPAHAAPDTHTSRHSSAPGRGGFPRRRMLVIALLLIVLVGVGGTVAFTTRSLTAENVLTFGNVKLQVLETEETANGEVAIENGHAVEASSGKASRIVRIQNVGASDMYVRARPVVSVERGDDAEVPPAEVESVVELGMGSAAAWVEGSDGWWYYIGGDENGLVAAATDGSGAGETTEPLMESIEFTGDFYSVAGPGGAFVLTVEVQAVQSSNNGTGALDAAGWPETEGAQG